MKKMMAGVFSHYSLLRSTLSLDQIFDHLKAHGIGCLGLFDMDLMVAWPKAYRLAKTYDIDLVFGTSFEIQELIISLVPKNLAGYHQLVGLLSEKNVDNLTLDDLYWDSTDLWVVASLGFNQSTGWTQERIVGLQDQFKDQLFLGIRPKDQERFLSITQENPCSYLIFEPIRFLNEKDKPACVALETLHRLEKGLERIDLPAGVSLSEAVISWNQWDDMDQDFLKEISFDYQEVVTSLPLYPDANGKDPNAYLKQLATQGLEKRIQGPLAQNYLDRLKYELSVIEKLGFDNYFLICQDIVGWAKNQDILVGPGRGSAASSLVAYSLGITDVDPLKYQLVFERFLNPHRKNLPDIDMDFDKNQRDRVVDYLFHRYGGKDHVGRLIVITSLGKISSLEKIAQVLNLEEGLVNQVKKAIKDKGKANRLLAQEQKDNPALSYLCQVDDRIKKLVDLASLVEGQPYQQSIHGPGIVLSATSFSKLLPYRLDGDGLPILQVSKEDCEFLGLIKFDLLTLDYLTSLKEMVDFLHQEGTNLKLSDIPMDDPQALALFGQGHLLGIFQMSGRQMNLLAQRLKPKTLLELMDLLALIRPGSYQAVDQYLENRQDRARISYPHPDLAPILDSSYGIILYQEQILDIAKIFAGLDYGQADLLRRDLGKMDEKKREEAKHLFIEGVLARYKDPALADDLWTLIEAAGHFSFARCHAAAYALITYQMAYLKAHFSGVFNRVLLDHLPNGLNFNQLLEALMLEGQVFLGPSLNHSQPDPSLQKDGKIRLGFKQIKNISARVASQILVERDQGSFKDYIDSLVRLDRQGLSVSDLRSLIDAGALDEMPLNRTTMNHNLDHVLAYAKLIGKDFKNDRPLLPLPHVRWWDDHSLNLLEQQKKEIGIYLDTHPLSLVRSQMNEHFLSIDEAHARLEEKVAHSIYCLGRVISVVEKIDRNNETMAFVTIEDEHDEAQLTIFSRIYGQIQPKPQEGDFIKVLVRSNNKRQGPSYNKEWICDQLDRLEFNPSYSHRLMTWVMERVGRPVCYLNQVINELEDKKTVLSLGRLTDIRCEGGRLVLGIADPACQLRAWMDLAMSQNYRKWLRPGNAALFEFSLSDQEGDALTIQLVALIPINQSWLNRPRRDAS